MEFRSDAHRKAVFANMFSGKKGKNTKVSSQSVSNFEVKSTSMKSVKFSEIEHKREKAQKVKKVKLKAPLFPPSIVKRRIDTALNFFYEDLEKYLKRENINVTPLVKGDNVWENNIVKIKQIKEYRDGRPKVFRMTFFVPSFVSPPKNLKGKVEDVELGYKHELDVELPAKYPDQLGRCVITSQTKFWSSRMLGGGLGRICLNVNGELDRIAFHLLQQLLWEPSIDSHSLSDPKLFAAGRRDEVHEYLKQKMREMHR